MLPNSKQLLLNIGPSILAFINLYCCLGIEKELIEKFEDLFLQGDLGCPGGIGFFFKDFYKAFKNETIIVSYR